ncbi:MAG: response regulator transcription factor [Sulfuricella sp.]|nr:response regulator transcription factor [Sulfuricella sp.]
MKLLIMEDDVAAARSLKEGLEQAGHGVDLAHDGDQGYALARQGHHDLWIMDVMMPGRDGLSVLKALRDEGRRTPALIVSALGEVDERVEGLRAGGDDYVVKPYAFAELLARVEALLRRAHAFGGSPETSLELADLKIDLLSRSVIRAGQAIDLQPREFRLLEYLMRNAGQVVTRTMLLENVWEYFFDPQTNVVDVHISRLRQKIDKSFATPLLHTVRGEGYILRAER